MTRKALNMVLRERYRISAFGDRVKILDKTLALTGYHCKHVNRGLGEEPIATKKNPLRNRGYYEATKQALLQLWEGADRVSGKRQRTIVGRLQREVGRKMTTLSQAVQERLGWTLVNAKRLVTQTGSR